MTKIRVLVCMLTVALISAAALAQMAPPKPGPELKRLEYFNGVWTLQGDIKPNQFGPAGKITETENYKWMEGGFFLLCNEDYKGDMGSGTGISILGYDPQEKVYTYDAFNSWGEAAHSKGTVSGDTWTWTSTSNMMGKPMQTKFTVKETAPDAYTFKFETAGADGAWSTMMDGKATKNK